MLYDVFRGFAITSLLITLSTDSTRADSLSPRGMLGHPEPQDEVYLVREFDPAVREIGGYSVSDFARALRLPSTNELLKQRAPHQFVQRSLTTELGTVALRYPATIPAKLKFAPEQVVETAWSAAARVMASLPFNSSMGGPALEWNVIIVDDSPLVLSGSRVSSSYCHTALMGPPADIVIDGYRLLHPCDPQEKSRPAHSVLAHSLVHEVGHGIEYRLLGRAFSRRQRWHGEGFASWFEQKGAEHLANAGGSRAKVRSAALDALNGAWRPYLFTGSPEDYAISHALIAAIADGRSPEALFSVYRRMELDNCLFEEAVERELGLTFEQWIAETKEFVR